MSTKVTAEAVTIEGGDYDSLLAASLDEIEHAESAGVALPGNPDRIGTGAVAWFIAYRTTG